MKDFEYYLALMQGRVSHLDTTEGSVVDGVLRSVAYGLAAAQQDLQGFAQIAFPDVGSGAYLDARAADVGLTRKEGSYAAATVTFTGPADTVIPAGTTVQTAAGLEYQLTEDCTIDDVSEEIVTGSVSVRAVARGAKYNVAANQISTLQSGTLPVSIVRSTAATGGADDETDAALLQRLQTFLRQPPSSGNTAQYVAWATSVPGVGFCRVIPRPNGDPYAVQLVLADEDLQPVSPTKAAECQAFIDTVREVCVDVECVPAEPAYIDISATVSLADGVALADVETQFEAALQSYLKSLVPTGGDVIYLRIAALLMDVPGVVNISDLLLNGEDSDITIGEEYVPVISSITLE